MKLAEEQVAFFHTIGVTLAQWAFMEANLQRVGSLCVPASHRRTVISGIASIENFRARVNFCDELMQASFASNPHIGEWQDIRSRLDKGAVLRNRLAHNVPVMYPDGEVGRRLALEPWGHEPTSNGTRPSTKALCLRNIASLNQRFHGLTADLASLQLLLMGGRPLPPEFHVPTDNPPSIRSIRDRIRGALGLPPLA